MLKRSLFSRCLSLAIEMRERIRSGFPKVYSGDLVEALFTYPIISPVSLGKALGIHYTTASRYLTTLASGKVLGEAVVGKYHFFVNKKLLELLKK